MAGCGAISTQVSPLLLPYISSPTIIPQTSCRCFRYLCTTMCVYTHNSILIRIMMLMPDCSNCSQVILAKYTMLLSLTHFSDLFWIIVILLRLNKPIYDICGLYYFYTRINFFLQFLFIILFEWFYFIMCPNHFFLKKNDSSLKKKERKKLI